MEDKENNSWKDSITSKRDEYAEKAENHLNSLPIEKRKRLFFLVFGALGLFILMKVIISFAFNSSTDAADDKVANGTKTEKEMTPMDILNMDISMPDVKVDEKTKKGLESMLEDIRKSDSIEMKK